MQFNKPQLTHGTDDQLPEEMKSIARKIHRMVPAGRALRKKVANANKAPEAKHPS